MSWCPSQAERKLADSWQHLRASRKRDGRLLSPVTVAEIRRRAVERAARDGEIPKAVVRALGSHRWVIGEWLGRYRQGGMAALQDQPVRCCPGQQGPRRGSGWGA